MTSATAQLGRWEERISATDWDRVRADLAVCLPGAYAAWTASRPGKPPFEAIVAAHGATVLRVCRAIIGPADADDAWSETFLSAMKAYPALPAKQKQAVAYHYLTGLPYAEVAAIIGGSADAVRRAAADGVAALRRSCPGR